MLLPGPSPGFSPEGWTEEQLEGEGREPRDGHLVFVLFFVLFQFFSLSLSLNKCHFLRQKEGTVNILDTLFFGVDSAPGAVVSFPPNTNAFP